MLGIHFWWQCPNLLRAPSPPALSWDGSAGSTSHGTYQHSNAVTAGVGTPCHAGKISNVVNSTPRSDPASPAPWAPLLIHPLDAAPFPGSPSPAPTLLVPWPALRRIFLACFSLTATSCALMALLMLTVCKREVMEGGEMGRVEAPSRSPPRSLRPSGSASTCQWLGPIQVPSPCLCQLDADLSRMPFWDAAGIHQVQLLPGLIYSG